MVKAQRDRLGTRQSSQHIDELKAQLAQLGKVENLQHNN